MKIFINRAGKSLGEFYPGDVRQGFHSGRFEATDLAWQEGMESWRPLGEVIDQIAPDHGGGSIAEIVGEAGDEPVWERRKEVGFMAALGGTIRSVLLEPTATFAKMKKSGGLGGPLLFYVILATAGFLVSIFYQEALGLFMPKEGAQRAVPLIFILPVGIVVLPIAALFGAFIGSGIQHLMLMIVGGAKRPFETTFRVVCYVYGATMLFQLLPFLGGMIGGIWAVVLMIIGLSEAQGISKGKSALAVFLPLIICCALGFVLFVIAVGAVGMGASEFMKAFQEGLKGSTGM